MSNNEYYLTGYQWGDAMQFIGVYDFPANKDQYDVHLPPRTTLEPIPSASLDPLVEEYYWTGTSWGIRPATLLPSMAAKALGDDDAT